MRGVRWAVLCMIFFCGLFSPAARADIPVTLVGQWGGPCYAVAVSGNRAYMGMGPRLVIMDASNASSPTVLSMSEVLPGIVRGVAVSGNYAYVADGSAGLQAIAIIA